MNCFRNEPKLKTYIIDDSQYLLVNEMFDKANEYKNQHFGGSSDLIPYWGLPETEDMIKI